MHMKFYMYRHILLSSTKILPAHLLMVPHYPVPRRDKGIDKGGCWFTNAPDSLHISRPAELHKELRILLSLTLYYRTWRSLQKLCT